MAKGELPLKSGAEFDTFTRWRKYLHWRAGMRARVKRIYNKRVRKAAKQSSREDE